jgi:DNA-binding transcriptional LysR family regulator
MDWSDWQIFVTTARAGSLTEAARALLLDQSTVSRRLAALENELGVQLFLRSRRGIEPTHAASRLLPVVTRASAAFAEAERVLSRDADAPRGVVRVATLESIADYMIVPALPGLLRDAPGITLELLPAAATVDLSARESDIALRIVRPEGGDLIAKPIDAGPLRAFAATPPHRGPPRDPKDLAWVGWDHSLSSQPEYRWMAAHRVPVVFRSSRASTMIRAAIAGVGCVLLPERFGTTVEGLHRVPVRALPDARPTLWLVTPRGLRQQPVVDLVWRWLLALFGAGPRPGERRRRA